MIDSVLYIAILIYLAFVFTLVKRLKGNGARAIVLLLLIWPAIPFFYKNIVFRIDCQRMVEETVSERKTNIDGVLVSYNLGMDADWMYWLVNNGGYNYADIKSGKEFDHTYWSSDFKVTQQTTSPKTAARYEIKILKSMPRPFLIKNEFIAVDRTTNKELGKKVVLFMQAGSISRFLNWKMTNDMDRGGLTCPTIRSTNDLLGFFPRNVLIPSPR